MRNPGVMMRSVSLHLSFRTRGQRCRCGPSWRTVRRTVRDRSATGAP
jgi:hypothetical protein